MSQVKAPEPNRAGWDPAWAKFMSEGDKPKPSQGPASDTGNIVDNAKSPPPQQTGPGAGAAPPPAGAGPPAGRGERAESAGAAQEAGREPRQPGSPVDAGEREAVAERITTRGNQARAARQVLTSPGGTEDDAARRDASNRFREAREGLQREIAQLESVRNDAGTRLAASEGMNVAASDLHWANTQLEHARSVERSTRDWRDPALIRPGEEIRIPTIEKPPAEAQADPAEVRRDLTEMMRQAPSMVRNPASVNDPLLPLAKNDPVSYAATKVASEHAGDRAYLETLAQVSPEVRLEYTDEQVSRLMDEAKALRDRGEGTSGARAEGLIPRNPALGPPRGEAGSLPSEAGALAKEREALSVLKNNMDAAKSPEERREIYKTAGEPHFDQAFFQQTMQEAAPETVSNQVSGGPGAFEDTSIVTRDLSPAQRAERIGGVLQQFGDAVPAEAAGTMLDAVRAELPAGMLDGTLFGGYPSGDAFYRGLSATVEAADTLGGNHAQEIADWLLADVHKAVGDSPGGKGRQAGEIVLDPLTDAVSESIAQGDGARLSVALHNALPKVGEDSRYDPDASARSAVLDGMARGFNELEERTVAADEAWREKNGEALFVRTNFREFDGGGKAEDVVATYRRENPDKAREIDAAHQELYAHGAHLHQAWQATTGLDFDPAKAKGAEQGLVETLKEVGDNPAMVEAMAGSPGLERQLGRMLAFGRPPAAALTVEQVDEHVAHVARELGEQGEPGLSEATGRELLAETRQWANATKQALGDGASPEELAALADRYHERQREVLRAEPGAVGRGTLESLQGETAILANTFPMYGWYAWGTRAARNFVITGADVMARQWVSDMPGAVWAERERQLGTGSEKVSEKHAQRLTRSLDRLVQYSPMFGVAPENAIEMRRMASTLYDDLTSPEKVTFQEVKRRGQAFEREASKALGVPVHELDPSIHGGSNFGIATRVVGLATYATQLTATVDRWQNEDHDSFDAILFATAYPAAWTAGTVQESAELYAGLRSRFAGTNALAKEWRSWGAAVRALPPLYLVPDVVWAVQGYASGDYVSAVGATALAAGGAAGIAASKGWVPPTALAKVGLGGPVVVGTSVFTLVGKHQYDQVKASNEFEYEDNPAVRGMVWDMGFSDAQSRELLNQTKDGVSPMLALRQLAEHKEASMPQMLDHLRSLSPRQIAGLVEASHSLIDGHADGETGELPETAGRAEDENAGTMVERGRITSHTHENYTVTLPANSIRGLDNWLRNQGMAFEPEPQAAPDPRQPRSPLLPPEPPKPPTKTYVVESGDTLWDIAESELATEMAAAQNRAVDDELVVEALDRLHAANPQFDAEPILAVDADLIMPR